MARKRTLFFLLLCSSVFSLPALAVEIEGLYTAQVPVKTQEQRERFQRYPEAISQAIVKMSGDTRAPDRPELAEVIANGRRLVQRYHYSPLGDHADPLLKEEGYTHKLVVLFDGELLTQALVQAGVPLWGRTRPEVLVWLAIEDREVRYVLAADASEELESHLMEASKRRGLPVLLPLMDLEDQLKVRFADVWGGFRQPVLDAAARYAADAVLVGRLYRAEQGPWEARWTLFQGRDTLHWRSTAWSQGRAIDSGIDGAADHIAARFAQVFSSNANGRVVLAVAEVGDLSAYARVMRYLQALDAVVDVQVMEVMGDEALFEVAIRTNRHSLVRDLALGNVLLAMPAGGEDLQVGRHVAERLVYRLTP